MLCSASCAHCLLLTEYLINLSALASTFGEKGRGHVRRARTRNLGFRCSCDSSYLMSPDFQPEVVPST